MARRKAKIPKLAAEAAVLGIALIAVIALQADSDIPVAVPEARSIPQSGSIIFSGTGEVPPINLKHIGPLKARIYRIELTSDNPVGILILDSFENVENFAQGRDAVYYTNCSEISTRSAVIECTVFDDAYIAIFNSGPSTSIVSLVIEDRGAPSQITGFAIKDGMDTFRLPYKSNVESGLE